MSQTPDRIRVFGIPAHLILGNLALVAALATPLCDLLDPQLGRWSAVATGLCLALAFASGLRDLLLASFNPLRNDIMLIHIILGFSIVIAIGYAMSRWQTALALSLAFAIDLAVAFFVLLLWWIGRLTTHRSAFASLLPRRIKK